MFLLVWHNLRSKCVKTILIIHDSKEHLARKRVMISMDYWRIMILCCWSIGGWVQPYVANLGVMQNFNSPPNEAQPAISPHITECNKMPKPPIHIAVSTWKSGRTLFLPDPGVSGVRSMGPGLSMYVTTRALVETLLIWPCLMMKPTQYNWWCQYKAIPGYL